MPATTYPTFDPVNPYDYIFDLDSLGPFSNFSIKVVMLSTDTSEPPTIDNFRALALS